MNRVSRSQAILVAAQFARLALFIGITSALGRGLAPAGFGFVAIVSALYDIATELLDTGTSATVTRQVVADPAAEPQAVATLLAWRRWAALACAGATALYALAFAQGEQQRLVLGVAAAGLCLLYLTGYHVVFQVRQAFGGATAIGLSFQTLFLVAVTSALVHAGSGAGRGALVASGAAIGLLVVAREIGQLVACRVVALRMLGQPVHPRWFDPRIGPLLRRSSAFGAAGMCYRLSALCGPFYLWAWGTPTSVGEFSAGSTLFGVFTDVAWMFALPLIASMSADALHRPWALRLQLGTLLPLMLAAACVIAVSGQFVSSTVLGLLYGATYTTRGLSAVPVLQWLAVAAAFALVTPVLAVATLARDQGGLLLKVSLAALAIGLAANALLIPRAGAVGTAIALCIGEAAVFVALLLATLRRHDVTFDISWLAALAPAALLLAALPPLASWPLAQLATCALAVPAGVAALRSLPRQREGRAALAAAHAAQAPHAAHAGAAL